MKRILMQAIALLACLLLALPAAAASNRGSVGLGVSVGVAFPQGHTDRIQTSDWDGSFNWGFYVNIPIIWTFHLTPSAELYRLNGESFDAYATDISLAFKFIIPLSIIDLYVGFVPGLTATGDITDFNVGGV